MTSNHGYETPPKGTIDWHIPLNNNTNSLDSDIEIRDTEDALSQYTPTDGAKFFAVDTGRRFLGEGGAWVAIPSHPLPETVLPQTKADPTDASVGDLWYRADVDEVRAQLGSGVVTLAGGPAPEPSDARSHVSFDGSEWSSDFANIHNTVGTVSSPSQAGRSLRIRIPEGEHAGANMHYRFADNWGSRPQAVHARWWLRLGENWGLGTHNKSWDVNGGKLPGFADLTYGSAHGGGDVTDSWSARGAFRPPKSGGDSRLGWYMYLPGKDGGYGNTDLWNSNGEVQFGQWYQIDQFIRMNTPGENDGVLRAWVDGAKAYENTSIKFRTMEKVKIGEFWLDVYMGGGWTAGNDMAMYVDELQLFDEPIDPTTQ